MHKTTRCIPKWHFLFSQTNRTHIQNEMDEFTRTVYKCKGQFSNRQRINRCHILHTLMVQNTLTCCAVKKYKYLYDTDLSPNNNLYHNCVVWHSSKSIFSHYQVIVSNRKSFTMPQHHNIASNKLNNPTVSSLTDVFLSWNKRDPWEYEEFFVFVSFSTAGDS